MLNKDLRCAGALAAALILPICSMASASDTPVPIGGEASVNVIVRASQQETIASDAKGNFVIAWTGAGFSGRWGLWARRYAASGLPLSTEFRVDDGADKYATGPTIAMMPSGEFVIIWTAGDGLRYDLRARRYSALGFAQGEPFVLDPDGSYDQYRPRAAAQPDGGFVVVRQTMSTGNGPFDIAVRRYDAKAQPLGPIARANTDITAYHDAPALAVGADGRYIVAWDSDSQEGPAGSPDAPGVYAQRFNPDGSRDGVEFRVAQSTAGEQGTSSVAYHPDGSFTFTWTGAGIGASTGGTFLRRFDALGQPLDGEQLIAQNQTSWNGYAAVATDHLGREILTWVARPSGGSYSDGSVWLRRFDIDGTPIGNQIEASTREGDMSPPTAAVLNANGDFVVLWSRVYASSLNNNKNVFFRRFRNP